MSMLTSTQGEKRFSYYRVYYSPLGASCALSFNDLTEHLHHKAQHNTFTYLYRRAVVKCNSAPSLDKNL